MGLGQSQCKDELWQRTSGIIHLHLGRAVRCRAQSHVSAHYMPHPASPPLHLLQEGHRRRLCLGPTLSPSMSPKRSVIRESDTSLRSVFLKYGAVRGKTALFNSRGLCTSIINMRTALEDSCVAPGWRRTAPALSFLKHGL